MFVEKLFGNPSTFIALGSFFISILALLVTILNSTISHRQYISSLSPALSFTLTEHGGILYLSINNTGKSAAKNISINIKKMINNGEQNELKLDSLFTKEIMLFPNETVQGMIGIWGENLSVTSFPSIEIELSYKKENTNKFESYFREISFSKSPNTENSLSKLEQALTSIAYSNNRLTNYVEGRTLFVHDIMNVMPHGSLYQDLKDSINNVERTLDNDQINQIEPK